MRPFICQAFREDCAVVRPDDNRISCAVVRSVEETLRGGQLFSHLGFLRERFVMVPKCRGVIFNTAPEGREELELMEKSQTCAKNRRAFQ